MGMETHSVRARSGEHYYHYYHCRKHHKRGDDACTHKRSHRAADVEGAVWGLVAGLLRDPERLRIGLDAMIETERAGGRGDPEGEARSWLGRLASLDRKRSRFQDMAAAGYITFEELAAKLRDTDEARATAERELAEVEGRRNRLEHLERDCDAIMEHYAGLVPEALDNITGEERHQVYRMIRLRVTIRPDGGLDVEGVLREPVCTPTGTWCSALT